MLIYIAHRQALRQNQIRAGFLLTHSILYYRNNRYVLMYYSKDLNINQVLFNTINTYMYIIFLLQKFDKVKDNYI